MRGRHLTAVLLLGLLGVGIWKGRKWVSSPAPKPVPASAPLPVPLPIPPPIEQAPVTVPAPKPIPAPVPQKTVPVKKSPPKPVVPNVPPPSVVPPRPLPPPPPPPPPQDWKGNNDTSIKHPGQIVVRNESQWIRFWAEHHPGEVSPDVDFSKHMVVGIFLGQRPADEFSVEITAARVLPKEVVVDYVERAPPPGTFQMSVEAYPYAVKVAPRSALPVKFNKLTAQYLPDTSLSSGTKP